MFRLFRIKKGCLNGKTEKQKISFFEGLVEFAITDRQFFEEQYCDLLPHEKKEFFFWLKNDLIQKKLRKLALNLNERFLLTLKTNL